MIKSSGFTLIEILLVVAAIGILGLLLANLPNSVSLITKAGHQSLARQIATKQMETKRSMQYINLTNGEEEVVDSRLASLNAGNGQITTSNCETKVCSVSVVISWKEMGKETTVGLDTLISEGGLNK